MACSTAGSEEDVLSNDATRIRGGASGLSAAPALLLATAAASDPTETRTPSESRGSNGVLGAELVTMTCESRFCVKGSSEVREEEANQEMSVNTREMNMGQAYWAGRKLWLSLRLGRPSILLLEL